MMKFDIITIFPDIFDSYFNVSIIKRARAKKIIDIRIHDLRKYVQAASKRGRENLPPRRQVDDRPYGGGPGMVLKLEPLVRAISELQIKNREKTLIILFSARGKQFDNKLTKDWSKKYNRLVMICGHYEGVDERIKKVVRDLNFKIEEVSIGPYVLTGGELPAMIVLDAVSRHIPGVLGKIKSLEENRYGVGVPVYTRPELFKYNGRKYRVPKILLSGKHKKIEEWRLTRARKKN
jgi:tRNA (guanine37-N1)-methyltransferase